MECKNCGIPLESAFCGDCGQKVISRRLTLRNILHDVWSIFTNVEKGFWYTGRMLFVAPGEVVRDYISGKTVRYYHPFRYLFWWITLSVALNLSLGLYDRQQAEMQQMQARMGVPQSEKVIAQQQAMQQEMKKYLNIIPLVILPFMALGSFLLFRRKGWNYAEHLVLNAYTQGQLAMVGLPIQLLILILPSTMGIYNLVMLLSVVYSSYVFAQFFQVKPVTAVVRNILTHLFGYLLAIIVMATFVVLWILGTR
jgi:hypothetical protein